MAQIFYDLHSHVLPGMDDGCKTPEDSVKVLQESFQQGVRGVFATPHYYPVEPVNVFLHRRDKALARLEAALETADGPIPEICTGAEVAFRPGISYEENLEKLCLGSSRYLLLEMPFSAWSDSVVREVTNICSTKGIIPVIAHIERYMQMQSGQTLKKLLEQDVLVQMNAEYLLNFWTRRRGLRLLKSGTVHLLGTDCHNMTGRPPNMGKAVGFLKRKQAFRELEKLAQTGAFVWEEAVRK